MQKFRYLNSLISGKNLLFIVLILLISNSFSQEHKVLDSYSFNQLDSLQFAIEGRNNLDSLRLVSQIQFKMAVSMNDSVKMARSLFYRCRIENMPKALSLADSIIALTSNSDSKYYPAIGYDLKGTIYYKNYQYSNALKNFIKANEIARNKNNISLSLSTLMSIAAVKNMNGSHGEAIDIYMKALNEIIPKPITKKYYKRYQRLYKNIGLGHLRLKQLDSSKLYFKKGLETSLQFSDSTAYVDFVMAHAQNDYHSTNFSKTRDSIRKYIGQLEPPNLSERIYYLAMASNAIDSTISLIPYFEKIDSISTVHNTQVDNFDIVYKTLIENSVAIDAKEKQIFYINKLLTLDSLRRIENTKTKSIFPMAFDIPFLKREKKELQKQLESKARIVSIFIPLSIVLLCLLTFFSVRFYLANKKVKSLISSQIKPIESIKPENISLDIDEDIVKRIRDGLTHFEETKGYIDPQVTQSKLAITLNTNTSYLSQVINYYKKINFSSYLKDLRVTNAINVLNNQPELSNKYTLSGLADMFGFKSSDSFSKSIKEKVQVNAATYLKRLRETHDNL